MQNKQHGFTSKTLKDIGFIYSTLSWNFFWKVGAKSVAICPIALQAAYRTLGCWEREKKNNQNSAPQHN